MRNGLGGWYSEPTRCDWGADCVQVVGKHIYPWVLVHAVQAGRSLNGFSVRTEPPNTSRSGNKGFVSETALLC